MKPDPLERQQADDHRLMPSERDGEWQDPKPIRVHTSPFIWREECIINVRNCSFYAGILLPALFLTAKIYSCSVVIF